MNLVKVCTKYIRILLFYLYSQRKKNIFKINFVVLFADVMRTQPRFIILDISSPVTVAFIKVTDCLVDSVIFT